MKAEDIKALVKMAGAIQARQDETVILSILAEEAEKRSEEDVGDAAFPMVQLRLVEALMEVKTIPVDLFEDEDETWNMLTHGAGGCFGEVALHSEATINHYLSVLRRFLLARNAARAARSAR